MRWRTGRRSTNVEDRRGSDGAGGLRLPGGRLRIGRRGVGGGLGTVVLVLVALYFGVDPSVILQGTGSMVDTPAQRPSSAPRSAREEELADFVKVVLGDTEDTWHALFKKDGRPYQEPHLVLFSGAVRSACGLGEAAMGPFYCPGDHKVYIDLSFYRDLKDRFGAPGDFAQAYVIAHEVGHHVQNLLGISEKVRRARQRSGEVEGNQLSVRQELQADCFAGLWANHAQRARDILEQGDLEEALTAAQAIGDDRLQKQSRGYVTPDSFTHGSSAQRMRWFKKGFASGGLSACDTFAAASL